jgi:ribosomal protein L11 methyltransferase
MFELVLRAPEALVETLSDALVDELDALSVTVEDADAGTEGERALFGEPGLPAPATAWARSTVRALFETEQAAEAAAAVLLAQPWMQAPASADAPGGAPFVQALQPVPDQDWVRLTQSQFAPVPVTPDFWIVPSWHEPPTGARTVIRLDPGLAFGTGTHPTTRMCLRWLAREAPAQAAGWTRVLDYGCGSGILGIAAAKLGARGVEGVDIDAAAVRATADNARRNGVQLQASLPDAPAAARGDYPLVLANILATPLKLLAPLLAGHVAPGGWLVMAGILERQAAELRAAYAPHLDIDVLDHEEGWILMGGRAAARAARAATPPPRHEAP